jgi:subtilisin family serine protease
MATPHIAGVAALILGKNPNLPPHTIKSIINHTAESLQDKYSRHQVGAGVANAYSAVLHA